MKKTYKVEWGYVRPFRSLNIVCEESIAKQVAYAIYEGEHSGPGCLILTDMSNGINEILADCM